MLQVKQLDFRGSQLFCGIDIHKKSWSICLRNEERELKTFSQDADVGSLTSHLRRYYPNAKVDIVYEAGFCGFWPQQQLSLQGFNCLIVNPGEVPQSDKSRRYKTDAVDCRKLALALSKGLLHSIHIPQESTIAYRTLLRTRGQLVQDQSRYKNRIISLLDFLGIKIPPGYKTSTNFSRPFVSWLEQLELRPQSKSALCVKINMLLSIRKELLSINKQIRQLCSQEPLYHSIALLRTIPGIGLISAFTVLIELEDIRRFKDFDHLASFAGFKPDVYASAEKYVEKGITHQCNRLLRETLVECAWMAISKDPALTLAYQQYKSRMHYNKAILRIAKKLLNRIRYVLLNNKSYEIGIVG